MSMWRGHELPELGVGLGYRPGFSELLLRDEVPVDFLEITVEHYLDATPEKRMELDFLRASFPLIPHGLGLSLGSAEGVDLGYVQRLAALIEEVDPPWWSEHICWTRASGTDIGHLTPLPFTEESLDVLCRNLEVVQREIKTPLILENITHPFVFPHSEMSEGVFLRKLCERTDCGLLLDVTNLYTNSVNHGEDVQRLLSEIPTERVVQLHFVGGHWHGQTLIDSHSHPTFEEVWTLMEQVYAEMPVKGAILERDERLPPLEELFGELERAREMARRHGRFAAKEMSSAVDIRDVA